MTVYPFLACMVGLASLPILAQDKDINWLGDYGEALRQAKESGKPIFLEFRCEA